jgi:imidazolonepropionase
VRCTTAADEAELLASLQARVRRMVRLGTTLAECKSGYGLTLDPEVKMLRVLEAGRLALEGTCDLVATYLGAHAVPTGTTAAAAMRDIVEVQIPEIKRLKDAGEIRPEMIDVFHETGVFVDETRAILEAGAAAGMRANFHGDELTAVGGAELGASLGALAVSHLEKISGAGIAALARPESSTVAVLLPTTAYVLRLTPPDARAMIDAGVPVALGSDFNPNAHCLSMPMTMNMACTLYRMTVAESLVAATANAACSMGRAGSHGVLRRGSRADLVVVDGTDWEALVYEMVDPPIRCVVKGGRPVSGEF